MKIILMIFSVFVSMTVNAAPIQSVIVSQKVEQVGVFDDWSAFVYQNGKDKVCYVSSMPLKSAGEYTRRGDVYLMVSDRPNEEIYDTVTFIAGYTFSPRSEAVLRVGNVKANLFTSEDTAWAKNLKTDEDIAVAMSKAVRVTVRGKTMQGIETYDTFSMKGFYDAKEAVNRLCRQPKQK
ncbi:MAG: invasion associated locus B family protein [Alphaproteobacteria bacterium]|nr:invasion associated locus B family protein [Alphaproteobacteria bacterium]